MAGGSLEASGAFVKVAVDVDVTEFPALKTGLMIAGVVAGKGRIMVATGPPDFSASDRGLFFFG